HCRQDCAMYAIIEDGSKQYRVSQGEKVVVDFREVEAGKRVEFAQVLLYQNGDETRIGQPYLEGMRVVGEVVEHPSEKHFIQHFRRRKNSRRFKGHRQHYTSVRVSHILLPGEQPPAETTPPPSASASSAP